MQRFVSYSLDISLGHLSSFYPFISVVACDHLEEVGEKHRVMGFRQGVC